jgi:hypothetical protein
LTNSSWFRRYSSSKSRCQSSNDGLHSVNPTPLSVVADRRQNCIDAWALGGGHAPAVVPPVRPRGLQGRHDASPCPSLAPQLPSRPLRARAEHRGAIAAVPLSRTCAPSLSSLGSIPPASDPAASPSTTSTPSRERLSEGEATLLASTATAAFGTSPEFEAAVVRAARPFSSLPFPLVSFPVIPGSLERAWLRWWGLTAAGIPPRTSTVPPCPTASTFPLLRCPVLATN